MLAETRRSEILQLIREGVPVRVNELSQRFEVSESTIRRDLQELDEGGLLKRTHGGAVLARNDGEPDFYDKEVINIGAKKRIAAAAAALVSDGDCIILDSGTTMLQLAKELSGRRITVVTNSVDVALALCDAADTEVVLLGGSLRKGQHSLVGAFAGNNLERLCADKAFIAANGVDADFGASTHNIDEANVKAAMCRSARECYLLVDSSKFGARLFAKIAPLESFKAIITDCSAGLTREIGAAVAVRVAGGEFNIEKTV